MKSPFSSSDPFNHQLLRNIHPSDWNNPRPAGLYNMVVIGAGTAGLITAAASASLGAKTALVERSLMGGDCLNFGCVPSKVLIAAAGSASALKTAGNFGMRCTEYCIDSKIPLTVLKKIRAELSRHDSAEKFKNMGIDVFFGEASFADADTVIVNGDKLRFRKSVIATGARPADPGIKGLEPGMFLTNETVFELTEIPDSLAVIGGGPIGCELAQAFSRLGSQVIIFHKNDHILDREDPEAGQLLESKFLNEGIKIVHASVIERVEQAKSKKLVHYTVKSGTHSIAVSTILVGVGRLPNIEGLNLEKAKVNFNRSGIVTNDYLQTSNRRIFAAGDVAMKYKFTHAADAAARIVVRNALFWGRGRLSALNIPWCTYTDPEIAHVGLYQHEAEAQKLRTTPYICYFTDVDRAVTEGQVEGFARVLVKQGSDHIVGATIVGKGAGELISNVVMAMNHNIGLRAFSDAIFPYPTRSIILKKLGDQYNRTRLTPLLQGLFRRWFKFLR